MTVDFINSLGITAKKITVLQDNSKESNDSNPILFQADGTSNNSKVNIGGFTVDSNKLYAGTPGADNGIELTSFHKLIAYKSNNQGKNSTSAICKIKVNKDIANLTVYIRSYAEPDNDYTMISNPNVPSYPTSYSSSDVRAHTIGKQNSGSALADYTKVEYHDLKQNNWIYVVYKKDVSNSFLDDTGYLLIPETAAISIETVNGIGYTFERDASLDIKDGASLKVGSNFSVDSTGAIKSTSGTIGGFTIDSNRLYTGTPGTYNSIEIAKAHNLIAYKSNNQGVASSYAVSKITVNKATDLTVYIRSYADSGRDYTMISNPNVSSYPTSYSSSDVKADTSLDQNSSQELTGYKKVEYYDLKQNDWIYVVYKKDNWTTDSGTDTGYLLIPETTDISITAVGNTYYFVRDASLDIKEAGASLKVGSNFSVDAEGKIYTTAGKIGTLKLTPTTLSVGQRFSDDNDKSFLYLNTENNYTPTG